VGCRLVLQVLDEPGARHAAQELCPTADISVIRALPVGRGRDVFTLRSAQTARPARPGQPAIPARPALPARPAAEIGRCLLLSSPTVRYDGWVSACCNEAVITGAGPAALRRRVSTVDEVGAALASFRADPLLRLVGRFGPVALQPVAEGPFQSVCQACWAAHDRVSADPKAQVIVGLLGDGR
jgi:hypothetical protein